MTGVVKANWYGQARFQELHTSTKNIQHTSDRTCENNMKIKLNDHENHVNVLHHIISTFNSYDFHTLSTFWDPEDAKGVRNGDNFRSFWRSRWKSENNDVV